MVTSVRDTFSTDEKPGRWQRSVKAIWEIVDYKAPGGYGDSASPNFHGTELT